MTSKTPLKIIITAGPTHEPIDAIRFITNYSSGIIGYELAKEASKRHHRVILITGPVNFEIPRNILHLEAETAQDMRKTLNKYFKWCNCLIMAAAVSDYRPKRKIRKKIKKKKDEIILPLVKNPDILKELGKKKKDKMLVGFCLETEKLIQNARKKLKDKNLDFVVANIKNKQNNPFGKGEITTYLIDNNQITKKYKNISKKMLSRRILDRLEKVWYT